MKSLSPSELSRRLSLYIDHQLGDQELREVERYLESHPDARKELKELQGLNSLLRAQKRVASDGAFWTRLSTNLEDRLREQRDLLPFPRKYIPLVSTLAVVAVLAGGTAVFRNRLPIVRYLTAGSGAVKSAYERGILQGSILPLLTNLDNNQVLQFALRGTLPLDAKSETALRIDESAKTGYRIEVGKTPHPVSAPLTMDKFYADIHATKKQESTIDSIFDLARRQLQACVLVGEHDEIAINPGLPQVGRAMVSGIAASLEERQRNRFGKLLEQVDAPYTFTSRDLPAADPEHVFDVIRNVPRPDQFVVVPPDSDMARRIHVDIAGVLRILERMKSENPQSGDFQRALEARRARFVQQFSRAYASRLPGEVEGNGTPDSGGGESMFFSIELHHEPVAGFHDASPVTVVPRLRRMPMFVTPLPEHQLEPEGNSSPSVQGATPRVRIFRVGPGGIVAIEISDSGTDVRRLGMPPKVIREQPETPDHAPQVPSQPQPR